ncbi:MAG: YncE family protein [Prevotellaceae bacterium]|jgi:hypothetical protein|nr:YncE family protein [Prevotellaceae bacterium]
MNIKKILTLSVVALAVFACNPNDDPQEPTITPERSEIAGLYILCEGVWHNNNSTLSYFEYETASFTNSYFELKNPTVSGLGDTGNDLKIYGTKMYAVMNSSNLVEIMNAQTAQHIATIEVPNCRYVAFDGGFAYVTSFAGRIVEGDRQLGYVAKIDTATFQIVATTEVDFQPEELAVAGRKLYVVNSGGYNSPNYSNNISVINLIDLQNFQVTKNITLPDVNLTKIRADKNGMIWVMANGNYDDLPPSLTVINSQNDQIVETLNLNISNFDICGDSLYFYGSVFNTETYKYNVSYGIVDINLRKQVASEIITDGTETQIVAPYGIIVNPKNGDIFISDALNYNSHGKVYCFNRNGVQKWNRSAGISPSHFCFLEKVIQNNR